MLGLKLIRVSRRGPDNDILLATHFSHRALDWFDEEHYKIRIIRAYVPRHHNKTFMSN